jgi:hypothetical protein
MKSKFSLRYLQVLHALWHACTLEPYKTLDPSLVSHTFVLFTTCLYYALLCWSWLAGRVMMRHLCELCTRAGALSPPRDTKLGTLTSAWVISIRTSGSRAFGSHQHGWSPTLPLGVVLLNKTLVNCCTATITFPIHVLSHRSPNRTCWNPTQEPATAFYPEPDQSNPSSHPALLDILILLFHLRLGLLSFLFPIVICQR